jgi:hypothetical protein
MIEVHISGGFGYEKSIDLFKFLIERDFSVDLKIADKETRIQAGKTDNQEFGED